MTRLSILFADPDPVAQKLATRMIQRLGHPSPRLAANRGDVIEALSASLHSVILIDFDAPAMEGSETFREIRQRAGAPVPWIVAMKLRAREPGTGDEGDPFGDADAVLAKPLSLPSLARTLAAATLRGSGAEQDFDARTWVELLRLFERRGVSEMLTTLARELTSQGQRWSVAVRSEDYAALKRLAHGLRGASLQFGAAGLAELCTQAEHAAIARERDSCIWLTALALERQALLVRHLQDVLRRP